MIKEKMYRLETVSDKAYLLELLQSHFELERASEELTLHQFWDSFDWRLFKKGWILDSNGRDLKLYQTGKLAPATHLLGQHECSFAWELPESDLKKVVAPLLKMRRLLLQATIKIAATTVRLLNEAEKIVAHLTFQAPRPLLEPPVSYITVTPVPEFAHVAAQIVGWVEAQNCKKVTIAEFLHQAARHADNQPGHYIAKPTIPLKPDMPANEAVSQILLADLNVIKINEPYILQDIDTEFLHHYRVAWRRSRSALAQMKGVFSTEETERFKADLRRINGMTNALRDLDVYLLAEADYRAMIPDTLQSGIDQLFEFLHAKRDVALQETKKALNSDEYHQIMQAWERFLNEPENDSNAPQAMRPILELSNVRIYKRYKRILKHGRQLLLLDDDKKMHDLRIHCKKLRYMMEFFITLYPEEKINTLILQLKKLQSILGDFNDYHVQETYLFAIVNELADENVNSQQTLLAIGSLITQLQTKRVQAKADFVTIFESFLRSANQQMYKDVFKTA